MVSAALLLTLVSAAGVEHIEPPKTCRVGPPTAAYSFNFRGSIEDLVKIMAKRTCKRFAFEPADVAARLAFDMSPIPTARIWKRVQGILEQHELGIVKKNCVHFIVPKDQLPPGRKRLPLDDPACAP